LEALLTPSFGDVLDVFAGAAAIKLPNMGDTLDTLVVVNDGQQLEKNASRRISRLETAL
jgi:hypothetical protein